MNYIDILFAVIVLGACGLLFGLLLAVASKIFAVKVDERAAAIIGALPGANCGGCGFAGCAALAAAIVEGKAPVNACAAGGNAVAAKVGEIMGVNTEPAEDVSAVVFCSGGNRAKRRFLYEGITDCYAASRVAGGDLYCSFGCLGLGSCKNVCKFGAITVKDNLAKIDLKKCTACGACIKACPRGIISMVPRSQDVRVLCSSKDKGANLVNYCEIGCIGCKLCQRACEAGAITVNDNLAKIDYDKCTNCAVCVSKCPRKLIVDVNGIVELRDPTLKKAQ
jgi:Na+-translocating ferredoxin:NAD+ oxidoreductase RNF subunit RnfB